VKRESGVAAAPVAVGGLPQDACALGGSVMRPVPYHRPIPGGGVTVWDYEDYRIASTPLIKERTGRNCVTLIRQPS